MADKKDFDKQEVLTVEQVQEQQRLYMQRYNQNDVLLSGDVVSKYEGTAKPKMVFVKDENGNVVKGEDGKELKQQAMDEATGEPIFYDPICSLTVAFNGGETQLKVSKEQLDSAVVGKRYHFQGRLGKVFNDIAPVFHTMTEL